MDSDFKNILIINFGQLGDVIMGLPAFDAVKKRFPGSKITIMVGKSGGDIIEIVGLADEKIVVDRVKLLRSNKFWSISQIFKILKDVRRRRFDLVIDLHSLYETNVLGFLSGAKHRLYANRENRSLDFLSNFRPRPPLEDKKKHLTEFYLEALKPLGIEDKELFVTFMPRAADLETVDRLLESHNVEGKQLVGINLGAGHPSRCWPLDKFAEVAGKLAEDENRRILVFFGPEEKDLLQEVEEKFPKNAIILNQLKLPQLAAAFTRLSVLIGNDTGPVHLGAVVGTSIVLILDKRAPTVFLPLAKKMTIINSDTVAEIAVPEVLQAARDFLDSENINAEDA